VKRVLLAIVGAGALAVGVGAMSDATQSRPDEVRKGSNTTIEFTVSVREYRRGEAAGAQALWTVCSATVRGDVSPSPIVHGNAWIGSVSPSLGVHGQKRLVGCLEDATLDRVIGAVRTVRPG